MSKPFGINSLKLMQDAHPDLVKLANEVNKTYQCTILSGSRTVAEEQKMVDKGLSKTMNSKHLIQPDGFCHALDIAPDPVDFDRKGFVYDQLLFAGYVLKTAESLGIRIRYGGDWNRNHLVSDESFQDLDHFELDG